MSGTTAQTLTITIPVPLDRTLSPNARPHWAERARAVKQAREAAYYATRKTGRTYVRPPLALDWEIALAKGQRRLDDTNAIASLKAYEDGIAEALGVDDRHFRLGTVTQVRDPDGAGYIRVRIESAAGEQTP